MSDLPPVDGNIMESHPDVKPAEGSSQEDEHWENLCSLVESGRLRIAPSGVDPRASARFAWKRHTKRLGMTVALALLGAALGWLLGSQIVGWTGALILVVIFWWILAVGAPDPFHRTYLKNATLFERSYLSGGILLFDTRTRETHEYPTEWRRIVTEI